MQVLPAGCIDPRYPSGCGHPRLLCKPLQKRPMMGVHNTRSTTHPCTLLWSSCATNTLVVLPLPHASACYLPHSVHLLVASGTTHAGVLLLKATTDVRAYHALVCRTYLSWCQLRHAGVAPPAHTPGSQRSGCMGSHTACAATSCCSCCERCVLICTRECM